MTILVLILEILWLFSNLVDCNTKGRRCKTCWIGNQNAKMALLEKCVRNMSSFWNVVLIFGSPNSVIGVDIAICEGERPARQNGRFWGCQVWDVPRTMWTLSMSGMLVNDILVIFVCLFYLRLQAWQNHTWRWSCMFLSCQGTDFFQGFL